MDQPVRRKRIAFFDYPDVFEDFYPHIGVTQEAFATSWSNSGNHLFVKLLQDEIGDVTWYCLALDPKVREAAHAPTGSTVRFYRSSWLHRALWRLFWLPRAAWRWRDKGYPAYAAVSSYAAMLTRPLLSALWRDRPDVFFVQDYANGKFDELVVIARLLRVPVVAYHSGSRPSGYVGERLKRWTIPSADALVVSSARERDLVVSRYRADPKRVHVVLTPLDTNVYAPAPRETACAAAGLDPRRRYFSFVGRLHDGVKRVSVLLRAFSHVARDCADVDLIVCGEGQDGDYLRALAAELAPGRVRFTGWVAEDARKAAILNASLALLLVSNKEGFPTIVGEALACGTPVIGTDVGGISELVEQGVTGALVPVDDESALAAALRELLVHPAAAAAMRANARAVAERRLSHRVVAAQLRAALESARG